MADKKDKWLDGKIPQYYLGKYHRTGQIQARYVISDFDLTYNVGNAVAYLLRNSRKHDSPIECLEKAINHLEFEIERLKENPTNINLKTDRRNL